jgi:hypothetical protein
VHSIFVAALAVIGVALFSIRGGTRSEEILLNMAAFLAPVVAFVPTGWSSSDCPSNLTPISKTAVDRLLSGDRFFAKFSSNNLVALVIGSLLGLALAVALTLIRSDRSGNGAWRKEKENLLTPLLVPAVGSALIVAAGLIWHRYWPASFNTHAHSYAAILMFILVGIVMVSTGERDKTPVYRWLYFAGPSVMLGGGVAILITGKLVRWQHEVLVLELVEATVFVLFWLLQTIELWEGGPPASEGPDVEDPLRRLPRRMVGRLSPSAWARSPSRGAPAVPQSEP